MALALCLASSHALSPRAVCSRRGALCGAAAALSLPASVRAAQPSAGAGAGAAAADLSARLNAGIRAMDLLLRDWDELTIDCTYAEVPRALLETKNKELLLEKASACVENSWLSLRPAGSSGGCFQHQLPPQAAPSFGQPRPISRVCRAGRPYRAACTQTWPVLGAGEHAGTLRQEHLDHGVQVEQQAGARRARAARQARRAAADGRRGGEHQRQGLRSVYATQGSNPRLADPTQSAVLTRWSLALGQTSRRPRGSRVRSRPRTPLLTSRRRTTAPTPPSSRARHPPQPTWMRPVRASQMHGTRWLRCRSSCEDRLLKPSHTLQVPGHTAIQVTGQGATQNRECLRGCVGPNL